MVAGHPTKACGTARQSRRSVQGDQHFAAFAEMSALLQEACEEVRMISGQLRKESQAVRARLRTCRHTRPGSSHKADK